MILKIRKVWRRKLLSWRWRAAC